MLQHQAPAHDLVGGHDQEVGIFEIAEQHQVANQTDSEKQSGEVDPRSGTGADDGAADGIVENDRRRQDRQVGQLPICIESERRQAQPDHRQPGVGPRQDKKPDQRDGQKDKDELW